MKNRIFHHQRKPRMLYCMHIDWNWIKQRPQFLAEALSNDFDISILFIKASDANRSESNANESHVKRYRFFKIPFSGRSDALRSIQKWLNKLLYRPQEYDYLWVCAPEILQYIDIECLTKTKIIYDCMDDMISEMPAGYLRDRIEKYERNILRRSFIVFASSADLARKIKSRGCETISVKIVRNAIGRQDLIHKDAGLRQDQGMQITYFGAISTWIDHDLILKIAHDERIRDIPLRIIGPGSNIFAEIPRIQAIGPVPRHKLSAFIGPDEIFLLPFKINEITLSVDPVKLYEYIMFGGKIVARYYPEIERFRKFVDFYDSDEEAVEIIYHYTRGRPRKYSDEEAVRFLGENTWELRRREILLAFNLPAFESI